jgi:hypothetical protein
MEAVAIAPEHLDAVSDGAMSVVQACAFTGDSEARLYQLMGAGVLVWFKQGEHRRITRRSLVEYLARALAAHDPANVKATPRKRGART